MASAKAGCGIPSVILPTEPFRSMLAQVMENPADPNGWHLHQLCHCRSSVCVSSRRRCQATRKRAPFGDITDSAEGSMRWTDAVGAVRRPHGKHMSPE
jgi:hypothetical protein